ncbi:MAG: CocE/NonD family hydrolase C-terminal non-catalytic domain-containing protein, partial [Acidimicrobiales bacterium]
IPDFGFPLLWAGFDRPQSELQGNQGRVVSSTGAGDPSCLEAYGAHEAPSPTTPDLTPIADNPIVNGFTDQYNGSWWDAHSLDTHLSYLGYTDAPVHIDQQYQDEQTGPRGGAVLFSDIESALPGLAHRIVFTNGRHDSAVHVYHADEQHWLDCYVTNDPTACAAGGTNDPSQSVQLYFETTAANVNPPLVTSAYPVPGTDWTRYYLNGDGTMTTSPGVGGSRSYLSTVVGRQDYVMDPVGVGSLLPGPAGGLLPSADQLYTNTAGPVLSSAGPDELTYATTFTNETTLAGPIEADLSATSTSLDTDYFVQLVDRAPDGSEQFLQYGLLRASFRAVDQAKSNYTPDGQMYRPYHPYTSTQLLTPGQAYTVNIEVFPLGWVFRPGHTLLVTISAPPAIDQLYSWAGSARPPGVNTILSGSSILLPLLPVNPTLGSAPSCGDQEGVRCTTPAETTTGTGLP